MLFGQHGIGPASWMGLLLAGLMALANPLGDAADQDGPTQPHSQASQAPLDAAVTAQTLIKPTSGTKPHE